MEEKYNKLNVLEILGKNIKQIRLLKGLSQETLASELQKSVNFISLIERGESGLSIQTIVDICNVLKVDANTLFSNIITQTEVNVESYIIDSINLFEKRDKEIIADMISYIINSKK